MKTLLSNLILLLAKTKADNHAPETVKTAFPTNCDVTGSVSIPNDDAMR
jgi:hypothetical protein